MKMSPIVFDENSVAELAVLSPDRGAALVPPVLNDPMAKGCAGRNELVRQAAFARSIGSPFVSAILEAGERQLDNAPRTAALIDRWPGNLAAAGVAMRFNAALHALARRGDIPALSRVYSGSSRDFDGALAMALRHGDAEICLAMARPTQTNEVGRAAAILGALMTAHGVTGMPFELMELGSSCGLNLNLNRYSYDIRGHKLGAQASPVRIAPEWRGVVPAGFGPIDIVSARGVDLNPPNLDDPATTERMLSYIWADQPARMDRLACALGLARRHKPQVDRGTASAWLAQRLAEPQADGVCRTIFHSMVIQYFDPLERHEVISAIIDAGERAETNRPLAWISFEWTPDRSEVRLLLTLWPQGKTHHLATCHPYGDWIHWHGPSSGG